MGLLHTVPITNCPPHRTVATARAPAFTFILNKHFRKRVEWGSECRDIIIQFQFSANWKGRRPGPGHPYLVTEFAIQQTRQITYFTYGTGLYFFIILFSYRFSVMFSATTVNHRQSITFSSRTSLLRHRSYNNIEMIEIECIKY